MHTVPVRLRHAARPSRVAAAIVLASIAIAVLASDAAALPITIHAALGRRDVVSVDGAQTTAWRVCPSDDVTYDIRRLTARGVFDPHSNLSVGNDCAASGVVTVGGTAIGTLSHTLTWAQVKAKADTDGLRFEGTGWLASFDLRVEDLEDGFAPRVGGSADHNSVRFFLSGAYMDWIRDDAIEDDDLMSGTIEDVLIDGANRFLSARPSASSSISNRSMVVRVRKALVHLVAMPNGRASDGRGFGGLFKWSDAAGKVDVANSIFFLDERPLEHAPFAPGTYRNVTLVLGFGGRYPGRVPPGVHVTHDVGVWRHARDAWLANH